MTSGILSDYDLANLIRICREMIKANHDWLEVYGDCYIAESPPNPCNYNHLWSIRYIVKDAMRYRREHKRAVNHVWKVYADSVLASLEKKGAN